MASIWQNEEAFLEFFLSVLKKAYLFIIYIFRNVSKYIYIFQASIKAENTICEDI